MKLPVSKPFSSKNPPMVGLHFGVLALMVYASLLCFPDEVEYIWKQKFSLPTMLYLLSRYPLILFFPLSGAAALLPSILAYYRASRDPGLFRYFVFINATALILGIATDLLAFIAVMHQVWGLWKLKRHLGLKGNNDLVQLLIQQDSQHYSFVNSRLTFVDAILLRNQLPVISFQLCQRCWSRKILYNRSGPCLDGFTRALWRKWGKGMNV
ncbi:hypothetical protein Clacol_010110 [Clathrus columnatus]|uniref:DUF6533 domain-containing protein n=1 Tax=Clathrus columnatus TaxID=1419009 RepID=A0AAV5APW3_9AGAM|nr:hypothetical protein Clacol_010110 [Clathrus columnatus]